MLVPDTHGSQYLGRRLQYCGVLRKGTHHAGPRRPMWPARNGDQELEGHPMYRLREWEPGDADRVLSAFTDPELVLQEAKVPTGPEEALGWIVRRAELAVEEEVYGFAIAKGDGPALGHAQVAVTSRRHAWGWVSYWTHAEARGKGVASAGARLVAEFAFAELGLFRLELGHRLNNPASCLVARRAGFRPEGIERAKLRYGDERFDTATHARLATDPLEGVELRPC